MPKLLQHKIRFGTVLFVIFSAISLSAHAQTADIVSKCSQYLEAPYISDGQHYQALLNNNETAEFKVTFYGGTQYRIIGLSSLTGNKLIFSLLDPERHILFCNQDFGAPDYWDFTFETTLECTIEAKLDSSSPTSGFAVVVVGFKP